MGFDLAAAVVYAAVFLIAAFRAGMFQWFWGSVLLWLGCGMIGAQLLPGIWGITHLGPLFFPHLYITAACFSSSIIGNAGRNLSCGRLIAVISGWVCLLSAMWS